MAPSSARSKTASVVASAGLFLTRGVSAAGFDGNNNVALYWGQNSYGQLGSLGQQPLATYCQNSNIDIIPMAFLVQVTSGPGDEPVINFANSGNNCTLFPGTGLLDCPSIGEDIKTCQRLGKTVLLSIGGATYTEGGFSSEAAAEAAAELVWRTFGPVVAGSGVPADGSSSSSLVVGGSTTSLIGISSTSSSAGIGLTSSLAGSSTSSTSSSTVSSSTTTSSTAISSAASSSTATSSTVTSSTTATSSLAAITLSDAETTTTRIPDSSVDTSTLSLTLSLTGLTSLSTSTRTRTRTPCNKTMTATTSNSQSHLTLPTITPAANTSSTVLADATNTAATVVTTFETTLVTLVELETLSNTNGPATAVRAALSTSLPCSTFTTISTSISTFTAPAVRRQSTPETLRPFHDAVIDGFDLDLETATTNFRPFALRLRALMASDTSKPYYLTAAPQCPYPDIATNSMLNGNVSFDAIFVQFYNNYCGVNSFTPNSSMQNSFNFATWNDWARNGGSQNKNVKVFLGVPAGPTAAGSGYLSANQLQPVIEYAKGFASFGGVMAWDASQAYANLGWLQGVKKALNNGTTASQTRRLARQWKA